MFLAFVISNTAWIYYDSQFETSITKIQAEQDAQGGNNYVVNGNYGETKSNNND